MAPSLKDAIQKVVYYNNLLEEKKEKPGCKKCSDCEGFFPKTATFFSKNKQRPDNLHNICKKCDHARSKERYGRNLDEHKRRHREAWKKNRRAWIDLLSRHGFNICSCCGYDKSFVAIDFHHENPSKKNGNVSKLLNRKITKERISEVLKCVPLCRNCHAELHWKDE